MESPIIKSEATEMTPVAPPRPREISGRLVVIGLLCLGVFATSLLFVYFEFHTRPFRPLREAIGRAFRHSRPSVEGGQVKGRGPRILRISLSVPFDPFQEDAQAIAINRRVLELAREHQQLNSFDVVEIHQIQFVPEQVAKRRTFKLSPAELGPEKSIPAAPGP